MTNEIVFVDKDQNWQDETTNYWFLVDGESYGISDSNGEQRLLDSDGCPVEDCNDHDGIKALLMPHYENYIND